MAAGGLTRVRERIAAACSRVDRPEGSVVLVAVTKGRTVAEIAELYDAGQRHFGENRADELAAKAPQLPGDAVWHFIGTLQSRQVRVALPHSHWVHSVDRSKLVDTIARQPIEGRPPRCLIQVNLAAEPQKHGVDPDDAGELIAAATESGLDVAGLMLIPPLPEEPDDSRRWYRSLVELRDRLARPGVPLGELSMGMTADFEVAVEEGATLVRVGRAIFDV